MTDVVLFMVDAEKGEGLELAKEYKVTGYPTFTLVNAEGEIINVWAGYGDATDFAETLSGALSDLTTISAREERYSSRPTAADADVLAKYHSARDEYAESVKLLREAAELDAEGAGKYCSRIFKDTAFGYVSAVFTGGDPVFTKDEVLAAADAVLAEPSAAPEEITRVAQLMQMIATQTRDIPLMIPYLKTAVERTEGAEDPRVQSARAGLLVDYALHVEGEKSKAVELKRSRMADGWIEDASELNAFAWWCFENNVNLEEAEALARKGVELAEAGKSKAMILDTLAEICAVRGDVDEALAMIRLAVAESPDEEYYTKQLARFEELAGG